jgi:hypothetical protein
VRIALIDVDGHNFPNLALMRLSAFYKRGGHIVEWYPSDTPPMFRTWYDIVYASKIFSDAYSPDYDWSTVTNAGEIRKGGTGYCISLGADGKEHFDESKNVSLPPEIERMFPDYSIYPQFDFAISMTSRGCPRGCAFCHVAAKEGKCAVKVADVIDFWNKETGKKEIKVLDPNITACREKRDLMRQYRETGCWIDFTQGIDIRLVNEADVDDLNHMKIKRLHFAWDNPKDKLEEKFRMFSEKWKVKDPRRKTVYCLTNFDSTMEENLYRVYTLRDLGYDPYVMIYNKPSAPREVRLLQRWVNNKVIFKSCKRFEDYDCKKG